MNSEDAQRIVIDPHPGMIVGLSGQPLIVDRMADRLSRLSLKDGDVLAVHLKNKDEDVQSLTKYLRAWLRSNGLSRVKLLGYTGDISLEVLTPEQVKQLQLGRR